MIWRRGGASYNRTTRNAVLISQFFVKRTAIVYDAQQEGFFLIMAIEEAEIE
jgi:hypothetical protein